MSQTYELSRVKRWCTMVDENDWHANAPILQKDTQLRSVGSPETHSARAVHVSTEPSHISIHSFIIVLQLVCQHGLQ